MVITVTLNPAIDKTVIIKDFNINKVNVTEKITSCVGGKGINVSKALKVFETKSIAITWLGGLQGKRIENLMEQEELKSKIIWLQEESRVNVKIIDLKNNTHTDINENGPFVNNEDIAVMKNLIKELVSDNDIVVFAGSVPRGVSTTIYKDIVEEMGISDLKVVIDASSELLKASLSCNPWLIKPNIHELREIANRPLETDKEIIDFCDEILEKGVENILVSLGEKGVLFSSELGVYKAYCQPVEAKNTVGAGDTVVASFIYASSKNMDIEEKLKYAVASGLAKVMLVSGNPTLKSIVDNTKNVTVEKIR